MPIRLEVDVESGSVQFDGLPFRRKNGAKWQDKPIRVLHILASAPGVSIDEIAFMERWNGYGWHTKTAETQGAPRLRSAVVGQIDECTGIDVNVREAFKALLKVDGRTIRLDLAHEEVRVGSAGRTEPCVYTTQVSVTARGNMLILRLMVRADGLGQVRLSLPGYFYPLKNSNDVVGHVVGTRRAPAIRFLTPEPGSSDSQPWSPSPLSVDEERFHSGDFGTLDDHAPLDVEVEVWNMSASDGRKVVDRFLEELLAETLRRSKGG